MIAQSAVRFCLNLAFVNDLFEHLLLCIRHLRCQLEPRGRIRILLGYALRLISLIQCGSPP